MDVKLLVTVKPSHHLTFELVSVNTDWTSFGKTSICYDHLKESVVVSKLSQRKACIQFSNVYGQSLHVMHSLSLFFREEGWKRREPA